jgi:hypothetical protein
MVIDESNRFDSNSAEIASSLLDGELVLINLSTGIYYSMGNVGSLIWQLTDLGFSVAETVQTIAARYDAPADRVRAHVHTILAQMLEERIFVAAAGERARGVYEPSASGAVPSYEPPVLHVYRDMGDLLALDAPMPDMRGIPWKKGGGD